MATAKKVMIEPEYILNLSAKEARTLYDVLVHVGGIAENSRRKYADNILNALSNAGGFFCYNINTDVRPGGAVYFESTLGETNV
jgi:hypothetical protein